MQMAAGFLLNEVGSEHGRNLGRIVIHYLIEVSRSCHAVIEAGHRMPKITYHVNRLAETTGDDDFGTFRRNEPDAADSLYLWSVERRENGYQMWKDRAMKRLELLSYVIIDIDARWELPVGTE